MDRRSDIPRGSWIAIGAGVGVALGAAFDNIAIGIAFGAAIGVILMAVQSNRETPDDDSDEGE